jgi:DNA polymerase-3 subunit beta
MIIRNNDLQDALKRIKPIVTGKTPLPILNHVLIESTPSGAVYLYATNLDTGVRIQLNATLDLNIETEFKRCFPYEALNSFSNSLSSVDSIHIRKPIDEHSYTYIMESTSGSASATIQTIPVEDFPTFDFDEQGGSFTGTGENSDINILADIIYCASADDSRFNLNGVYLDSKAGLLVATDGHRLATRKLPQVLDQLSSPVIIPRSGIKHLEVFFKGTSGYIQGYVTGKRIMISNLQRTMVWTCRLMDSEYPSYEKVIPGNLTETCTLPAKETRKFLKGLNISKKEYEANKGVTLKSNCDGINIFRKDSEGNLTTGKFMGTFPEPFEVILNRNYLVELIDHTDNLTLLRQAGASDGTPVAIKSSNGKLDILMPMRK